MGGIVFALARVLRLKNYSREQLSRYVASEEKKSRITLFGTAGLFVLAGVAAVLFGWVKGGWGHRIAVACSLLVLGLAAALWGTRYRDPMRKYLLGDSEQDASEEDKATDEVNETTVASKATQDEDDDELCQ
jgi:hypothetical protein